MIMYSTISEEEHKVLQSKGILECDPALVTLPAESEEIAIAYKYMADKLRGKYPSTLVYPRWAYTMYDGEDVALQPDVVFAERGKKTYRLKLDVKEYLLSDIDAWTCCLNLCPVSYSEEEDDQFDYWTDIAHLTNRDVFLKDNPYTLWLRQKVVRTWDRIFDINAKNDYVLYEKKTIQAVFWRIRQENVLDVKEIQVDDETYRKYHGIDEVDDF